MPRTAISEWILVTGAPPASELSDLLPSLDAVLDREAEKGILDLDALGGRDASLRACDGRTLDALERIGALDPGGRAGPLYSPRAIADDDDAVPLWGVPPVGADDGDRPVPAVLEARVHLGPRARPAGWFLRLPCRSVVHAVLAHLQRAEEQRNWRVGRETKELKRQRKEWRHGLTRGVWSYNDRAELETDSGDIKELMWGVSLGDTEGEEEADDANGPHEEGGETIQTMEAEEQQPQDRTLDDYLQKYCEANPYPTQSPAPDAAEECQYHLLKSGSTTLRVKEFVPHSLYAAPPVGEKAPWEQHSFRMSPLLNLSDSVVRVEARDLRTHAMDVRYQFRGYDLAAVPPDAAAPPSSEFADLPRSLGWDASGGGGLNVSRLVEGRRGPRGGGRGGNEGRDSPAAGAQRDHAFLVRFATPADARMAVRDKQGDGRGLRLAQYPRMWP